MSGPCGGVTPISIPVSRPAGRRAGLIAWMNASSSAHWGHRSFQAVKKASENSRASAAWSSFNRCAIRPRSSLARTTCVTILVHVRPCVLIRDVKGSGGMTLSKSLAGLARSSVSSIDITSVAQQPRNHRSVPEAPRHGEERLRAERDDVVNAISDQSPLTSGTQPGSSVSL